MASPISPRVSRGALLRLTTSQAPAWGLEFPFNPESLQRTLVASDDGRPQETIAFVLRLDATDALADGDPLSTEVGVHPQIAVLERLVRPAAHTDVTLFTWGSRAVPVTVRGLTVRETMFDPALNPIRADIEVTLHVLPEDPQSKLSVELVRAHEQWHEHLASQAPAPPAHSGWPIRDRWAWFDDRIP